MRRSSVLIATGAALTLVVSACSGGNGGSGVAGSDRYATDGTFTMAVWEDLGVYDPYRNNAVVGGLAWLAYDSLLNRKPDGAFVSGLAEKWSADAHTATFTLRPDVTCSDGTPLTAGQVASAINYVSDPKNESPQYGFSVPTVPLTASGDDASRVVKVVVKEPFGFLLNTIGQLPIMCAKGLEDPAILKTASDGTGPYVLAKMVPGQGYTFTRREGYTWGADGAGTDQPGMPQTVVVRVVANKTTAANLLLSGELNFAEVTREDQARLEGQGLGKVEVPAAGAWLWLNKRGDRPLADKRVRQALVHAVDLDELVKVSTGGSGTAATGLTPREPNPCPADTVAGNLPAHDVAAAEKLLDEAGWVKGSDGRRSKNGKPLTLSVHFQPDWAPLDKTTAELLAQRWRAVGADVRLSGDTTTIGNQTLYETNNYDVYVLGYNPNLPSILIPFVSGPVPPNGRNHSGIVNAEYDALVAKARTMTPPAACKYWNDAERALIRNVDVVPISERPWLYYLKNAEASIIGYQLPAPTSLRVLG